MNQDKFKQFMSDQIHEIEVHKYIESEKAGHDLGDAAKKDWIQKYAKEYREYWEKENGEI